MNAPLQRYLRAHWRRPYATRHHIFRGFSTALPSIRILLPSRRSLHSSSCVCCPGPSVLGGTIPLFKRLSIAMKSGFASTARSIFLSRGLVASSRPESFLIHSTPHWIYRSYFSLPHPKLKRGRFNLQRPTVLVRFHLYQFVSLLSTPIIFFAAELVMSSERSTCR